jgi:hypothetical protein
MRIEPVLSTVDTDVSAPERAEWRRRMRADSDESLRRRAVRAGVRRDMAKRRRHGLDARQATKLSRWRPDD